MAEKVNPTFLASLIEMGIDEEVARQVNYQIKSNQIKNCILNF